MTRLKPGSLGLTLLLGGLTVTGAAGIDMSLPAAPTLTASFATTPDRIQLNLSLFMLGLGTGQLIWGPLSDRFGRRPLALLGVSLYTLAGFVCAAAPDVGTLTAARFVQGAGASLGPVLNALLRDHHDGARVSQMLSRLTMVMALAPLLAPSIGGLLLQAFGWRAIFLALGILGLLLTAITAQGLDESLRKPDPRATELTRIAANLATILTNRQCLGYIAVSTFVVAGILAFVSGAPFVLIEAYGIPAERFGLYFALTAPALILGAFLNNHFVRRVPGRRLTEIGLAILMVAGCVLLLFTAMPWGGPPAIMAAIMAYLIGQSLVLPNAIAAALEPLPQMAGMGGALMGAFHLGGAGLAGYVVNALFDGTGRPMGSVIALMGLAAFATYWLLVRGRRPL